MSGNERRLATGVILAVALLVVALALSWTPAAQALDPSKAVTQYALDRWSTGEGLPQVSAQHIIQTRDGYLWIATQEGLARFDGVRFTVYDKRTSPAFITNSIEYLAQTASGDLWAATTGGGLVRIRDGEFRVFTDDEGLSSPVVFAVYEDRQGTLWFGTTGGLLRYQEGQTHAFTYAEGRFDDTIHRVLEDDAGSLWMSTNRGIFRVARRDLDDVAEGRADHLTAVSYGRPDGMRSEECNGGCNPAGWRSADGRLWFPTVAGVVMLDPARLQPNPRPPPVLIETVTVDDQPRDPGAPVLLAPNSRRYEIAYTALTFLGPERVRFRYKLEGLDADWIEAGTRRTAYLNTLPPGVYTFRVTACNADGVWNEQGASLTLVRKPHCYESTWFYVVCGAVVLLLIIGFYNARLRQASQREQQLIDAVENRTRELRKLTEELRELTLIDPLTGLRNRRYLFETATSVMEELVRRRGAQRTGEAERATDLIDEGMGVLIVDLDHFKQVNDTWGHDAGDVVLKDVARLLRDCVRPTDIAVRWGGEEFLVVLPRTRRSFLPRFAERIRARLEQFEFCLPGGATLSQTCSVGAAGYPFFETASVDVSLNQLITLADMALYRAKDEGRNRVIHLRPGDKRPEDGGDVRSALVDLAYAESAGYLIIDRPAQGPPSVDDEPE